MRIERDADYGEYVTNDHLPDYSLSFRRSDDNYTDTGLSHIDASSSEPAVLHAMPASGQPGHVSALAGRTFRLRSGLATE